MAISNKPWSLVTPASYGSAGAYCKACLIDENDPGSEKIKSACKLPVYEPDGDLNSNGVHAAAAVLAGGRGGVDATASSKASAARKLISLYGELEEEPPPSLRRIAG